MDDASRRERALMFMRGWFGEPMDDDTREELIRLLCAFAIAEMGARERRTKSVLNNEPGVPAAPSVDRWKPIETAPRNGTRVLLIRDGHAVCGLWYHDNYANKPRPYWTHDQERIFGKRNARECPPTHWMPIPAVPQPKPVSDRTTSNTDAAQAPPSGVPDAVK